MTDKAPARRRKSGSPAPASEPVAQLEFASIANESAEALVARGAAYVRRHQEIQGESTTLLRNIAVTLVALQAQNTTSDGRVDWGGRSGNYRRLSRQLYQDSGIGPEAESAVRQAVRYHVGKVKRAILTPEELAEYGLLESAAEDRNREARRVRAALVTAARALTSGDAEPVKAPADNVVIGGAVRRQLAAMEPAVLPELPDDQRAVLDADLADAARYIVALRRALKQKRSSGA